VTTGSDFTPEEWELVLEGPTTAGMLVLMADRGGSIRESFSMAKAYTEARKQHGQSELLDEVVSTKPKVDRTRHRSLDELTEHGLAELREVARLLERKATPEELDDYRRFALAVAARVARAHKEGGQEVSDAERAAIGEIEAALETGGGDTAADQ
jgi:hypothetical protein